MQHVALFSIRVMQQRNVRAAIGVILNRGYFGRHANLVPPEIHLAVLLLVPPAAMPDHDFAVIVASPGALFRLQQRLFRLLLGDVALIHDGDKPPRRRIWIKAFQSHRCLLPSYFFPAPRERNEESQNLCPTNSPRTRSSFRLPPASRRLSSSPADTLRSARAAASCRENSRCALRPLSP